MNVELIRAVLGWSLVFNWSVLFVWFVYYFFFRDFYYRFHGRMFNLTVEQFGLVHYGGMAIYKIFILVFNLAPYLALRLLV